MRITSSFIHITLTALSLLLACSLIGHAQDTTRSIKQDSTSIPGPVPRMMRAQQGAELKEIRFVGLQNVAADQLLGVIESRESSKSLTRQLSSYYLRNLEVNPATPNVILNNLRSIVKQTQREIRYFNKKTADQDVVSIKEYLSQNGFHKAAVSYAYGAADSTSEANVLTFTVIEGQRGQIDTLAFIGLERVPEDLRSAVLNLNKIKTGDPYVEANIESSIYQMNALLRNSGYYKSRIVKRATGRSDDGLSDTVVVLFEPHNRVRISEVVLYEYKNNQPGISEHARKQQLEFTAGDWYSDNALAQTRSNLMMMGTFESVVIDTIPVGDTLTPGFVNTDSTIVLRVVTRNSKVYDASINFLAYQTAIDNYTNLGVGFTGLYKNFFGDAVAGSFTAQYILQDISRSIQGQQIGTEIYGSFVLAWPTIFRVGAVRAGLQNTLYYSNRSLVKPFRLEGVGISSKMPMTLYAYTFFNSAEVNIGIERQVPIGFSEAQRNALAEANTRQDSIEISSTFTTFTALDRYLKSSTGILSSLTGFYLGGTIRGEHRDNPIDPRKFGWFNSFSGELGLGAGQFFRMQIFNVVIIPITAQLIFANKFNFGHIFLLNYRPTDSLNPGVYVPLERQFFAGGASSIRSFASRLLHDPVSGQTQAEKEDPSLASLYSNILGSATLLELSVEFRYDILRSSGSDDLIIGLLERSGIAAFADYGNAFNRLVQGKYGTSSFSNFISGSVLAMGMGYRFATPIGPLRVDVATSIYNPLHPTDRWITTRPNALGGDNLQLSIGLGHTF